MQKCRELSRLPRAPAIKSIRFKRQTPGCSEFLLNPRSAIIGPSPLDRSHPALRLPRKAFPNYMSPEFGLRIFPIALLQKPDTQYHEPFTYEFSPWSEVRDRLIKGEQKEDETGTVVKVACLNASGKKQTSASKVIRGRIMSKIKTALTLIITRGANSEMIGSSSKSLRNAPAKLVLNPNEAVSMGRDWILKDWVYIFFPKLEIYRMPYTVLVPKLRLALAQVRDTGRSLEQKWLNSSPEWKPFLPPPSKGQTRRLLEPLSNPVYRRKTR